MRLTNLRSPQKLARLITQQPSWLVLSQRLLARI